MAPPSAPAKEVELQPSISTPPPDPTTEAVAQPTPAPPEPSIEPVIKFTGAFATPETVLYDAEADRYLVSNINIGYDSKRKRLLVPRFTEDTVEVYELK